jgi:hypothetical protein
MSTTFKITASANKTTSTRMAVTFNKRLGQYNKQLSKNSKHVNRLIVTLKDIGKNDETIDEMSNTSYDIYLEIEDTIGKNRRLMNLKRKLYTKHNLHWDEEFY